MELYSRLKSKPRPELDEETLDDLRHMPTPTYERGAARHPLFKQWRKMMLGCCDPSSPHWAALGGRGVRVARPWFVFETFVDDMEPTWDSDISKPDVFRKVFLHRKNLRAGFNKNNAVWVMRKEALQVQSRTLLVPTPWGRMTLRELEQYLIDHEGEDFPPGIGPYKVTQRNWDMDRDRFVTDTVTVTSIWPVKLGELRKRHWAGKELWKPTRPYGDASDRIERQHIAQLDADRNRRERAAAAMGITLAEYDRTHYMDGTPLVWGAVQHPNYKPDINS
jgi:hypothetical protein